ncbi:class I SAM-dependent methyltransferase [Nanoarchaeota archaeon]
MHPEVEYTYTNENLDAVMAGLDVQPNDNVLAICGSGDQSFAMLEIGARITAIDHFKSQLEYAQKRAKLLKTGDYEKFLRCNETKRHPKTNELMLLMYDNPMFGFFIPRNTYFRAEDRLEKIKGKLDNLNFTQGDIFEHQGEYSKVYLSNAAIDGEDVQRVLGLIPVGGLIYSASHIGDVKGSKIHKDLTKKAQKATPFLWDPTVYVRTT